MGLSESYSLQSGICRILGENVSVHSIANSRGCIEISGVYNKSTAQILPLLS